MESISLRKCLNLAVVTEQVGAKFYDKMAKRFADNPEVGPVFAQLSKDEEAHEAQFKALLEKAPDEELGGDFETQMVLRATAISEFFRQDALKVFDNIETPRDALVKALALEKSTLFYYLSMRDALGAQPELDALIKAEKAHVAALMKVILSDAEFRGLADQWA